MKNKKTSYKKVHKKINGQTIHINGGEIVNS